MGSPAPGRLLAPVLAAAGFTQADVKLWVFHQANIRILDAAAESLGIDRQKCEVHIDRYGNTSAGSVPIALDESFAPAASAATTCS